MDLITQACQMPERRYPPKAITPSKLLDKICFIRFCSGRSKKNEELKKALYDYRRQSGHRIISQPAITYWFNGSAPSRKNGFEFLLNFIHDTCDYQLLSDPQKKVFDQVKRELSSSLASTSTDIKLDAARSSSVYTRDKSVVIEVGRALSAVAMHASSVIGSYRTYRIRFSEPRDKAVAQELLHIFVERGELRFFHWFLRDGTELDKFSGVVFVISNIIWLIGMTEALPRRLRIMSFRNVNFGKVSDRVYKWGLVMGALSNPASPDPAAARIFLDKVVIDDCDLQIDAEKNVKALSEKGMKLLLGDKKATIVNRLIKNNITAQSIPRSWDPFRQPNGIYEHDLVLRVNEVTLSAAIDGMSDVLDDV